MKKKFLVGSSALLQFLYAVPMQAQGLKDSGSALKNIGNSAGIDTTQDVGSVAGGIISAALSLVGVVFLVLMVYAGFLWMTAQGETDQIDKAKKIIISSIIGLVVVLSAYAITSFVTGSVAKIG